MRRLSAITVILLALASGVRAADPPTLEVDRNALYIGESVTAVIRVPGNPGAEPDLTGLPDVRSRLMGQPQYQNFHSFSFVNGRRESSGFTGMIYQYAVQPLKDGPYPGGTVKVTADGQTYALPFPPLNVMGVPAQDEVRMDLLAEPVQVLPDDSFTVTLRLRVRRLPAPFADVTPFHPEDPPQLTLPHLEGPKIDGLEMQDLAALFQSWRQQGQAGGIAIQSQVQPHANDPFGMGALFNDPFFNRGRAPTYMPAGRVIDLDGVPYFEFLFPVAFTARDEGDYAFGPATLRGRVITAVDNRRRAQTREFYAMASPVTVRVIPPPQTDRPASFFGLSGTNLTVDAQLSASACRVGDPLKLTLSVRGPVNWRRATAPDPGALSNLTERFRLYGSTMQTLKTGDGRDFTFTLRPLQPGTYEIPPIPVSFYDTVARTYRTVETTPIPLQVEASSELTAGAWADPRQAENPAADSASSANAPAALRLRPSPPDALSPFWFIWLALGPLVFVLRLSAGRLGILLEKRRAVSRPRLALDRALKGLRQIKPGDTRRTAEAAGLILRTFAADKLNREPGGMTGPEWADLLRRTGAPEEAVREFLETLDKLAEVAYSPTPKAEVEAELLPRLPALLRRLAGRAGLILLLLAAAAGQALAQDSVTALSDFEWREAQALSLKASLPSEFREAADRYARMAADGRRDGVLFYNLGTCRLLAGEPKAALAALVRAERYLGRPPDLIRNMALARAALNGGESAGEPWDRTLLLFHYGLPWPVRIRIAVAAFGLFLLLGSLAWRRADVVLRFLLTLILLTGLLFGISSLVTQSQENQEPIGVMDSTVKEDSP